MVSSHLFAHSASMPNSGNSCLTYGRGPDRRCCPARRSARTGAISGSFVVLLMKQVCRGAQCEHKEKRRPICFRMFKASLLARKRFSSVVASWSTHIAESRERPARHSAVDKVLSRSKQVHFRGHFCGTSPEAFLARDQSGAVGTPNRRQPLQ